MKICVFSDSHGLVDNMIAAIRLEKPEMCFFLGDGLRDLDEVMELFPDLPIYAVRGNCDFMHDVNPEIVCSVDGVRIFATHGHMYNVKYEARLDSLTLAARNAGASVALFGHTHMQHMSDYAGVTRINPGTIGRSRYPCYAVLETSNGGLNADLRSLD